MKGYIQYIRSFYKVKVTFSDFKIEIDIPKKQKNDIMTRFTQILPILISTIILTSISVITANISGNSISLQSILFYSSFLIASIFSMIIMTFIDNKRNEKSYSESINKWREIYEVKKDNLMSEYLRKFGYLKSIYKDNKLFLLKASEGKSAYLWNVVPNDEDFLSCQLGRSIVRSNIIYSLPTDTDGIDEEILNKVQSDKRESEFFEDAPFIVRLNEIEPIGIYGNYRHFHLSYIITNFLARHDDTLVKLVFLSNKKSFAKYEYIKWLPHIWSKGREVRFIDFNEGNGSIIERINELYNDESSTKNPFILFVLDTDIIDDNQSELNNMDSNSILSSKLLELAKNKVASKEAQMIIINQNLSSIPSFCKTIIDTNQQISKIFNTDNPDGIDVIVERYDDVFLDSFSRNLSKIELIDVDYNISIPNKIGFLQLNNIDYLSKDIILNNWEKNKKIKCLIGAEKNSNPKLSDNFKHAIIAGKAGSGKSQFISSFVIYLALNYSPSLVNFLFIDFKGETLTNNFKNLPHMVGSFSNLVSKRLGELNRIKVMLRNELEKRQNLINAAMRIGEITVADIEHYNSSQKFQSIPHLFIIIDEYVELLSSQSDIIEVLESISRLGRSSGLHLILSSQRLDNKISDQIRTNIDLSICFKVNDLEESRSMLGISGAENIRIIGRGFVKNENNYIEEFQAPWVEKTHNSDNLSVENKIFEVTDNGKRISWDSKNKSINITELSYIVNLISSFSSKNTSDVFIPSLKDDLYWDDFIDTVLTDSNYSQEKSVILGLIDDFNNQKQEPYKLNISNQNYLIIGGSGKGKTELLMSILFSYNLLYRREESQFYIISIDNNNFKTFEKYENVYPIITEYEQFFRLIDILEKEIKHRKEKFGEEFVNIREYNNFNVIKMDEIFVLVDNIDFILEKFSDFINERIENILKISKMFGMSFVFTSNASVEIRSLMRKIDSKIFLYNSENIYFDKFDHLNNVAIPNIPGRCLVEYNGRILETQIFMFNHQEGETIHKTMSKYIDDSVNNVQRNNEKFILPKEIYEIEHSNLVKISNKTKEMFGKIQLSCIPLFLDNYTQTAISLTEKFNSMFIFTDTNHIYNLLNVYISFSAEQNIETHIIDFNDDFNLNSYPGIKRYVYKDNLSSILPVLTHSENYKFLIVSKYSDLYNSLSGVKQDVLNDFDSKLLDIYNSMSNKTILLIFDQNNKNPLNDSELMYNSSLYSYFRKNPKYVVCNEAFEFGRNAPCILDLDYNRKILPNNQAWFINNSQISRVILPKE